MVAPFVLLSMGGQAAPPQLVRDINTIATASNSQPLNFKAAGGTVIFTASDGIRGQELWKTDGTAAGTVLVKDILPGNSGSNPGTFHVLGTTLYFAADDGVGGIELWKSDGTAGGTQRVKDILPGAGSSFPNSFVVVGSHLYFFANSGGVGYDLWKSDGTEAGTVLVRNIWMGVSGFLSSSLSNLTAVGNTLFFTGDDGMNGAELWKSDGTTAGTMMVKDIHPGSQYDPFTFQFTLNHSNPGSLKAVGNVLYFSAEDGIHGQELWKSDGTEAGTVMVKDIQNGGFGSISSSMTPIDFGGNLYFIADDGVNGSRLWKSDETPGGTTIVNSTVAINPWTTCVSGAAMFFTAWDSATGYELWKSDGTEAGTVMVKDIRPGSAGSNPEWLTDIAGTLYFRADNGTDGVELWKSDGTEAGTLMVKNISAGSAASAPFAITAIGGTVFFGANDGINGSEFWKSDGTEAGTVLVKNINQINAPSNPAALTEVGGKLLFAADNGILGQELWTSDGTTAGTQMVRDIRLGATGSLSGTPVFTAVGTQMFFVANDGTTGLEIWKSDGTNAGTTLLKDIRAGTLSPTPQHLTAVGNMLFFSANDNVNGPELWKSDGTEAGTVMVRNIRSGSSGSSPSSLVNLGGILYFVANDGVTGAELWKSNGSDAGTTIVKDIRPGTSSSGINSMTPVGTTLFFTANDGVNGTELWKSDGTAAGTVMVKDITPGSFSSTIFSVATAGGVAYFTISQGQSYALWKSDGTTEGTVHLRDIQAGKFPAAFTAVGNTLFFTVNEAYQSYELWKSDGTTGGTVLVKDIRGGSGSPSIQNLKAFGDRLYFSANDGITGAELWRSDGTTAGTSMVYDLTGDSFGSNPENLTVVGERLYFSAAAGSTGRELWSYVESVQSPNIALEKEDGTPLPNNKSSVNLGIVNRAAGPIVTNIIVRNTGDDPLDISDVHLNQPVNPFFAITTALPANIPPGGSAVIGISYDAPVDCGFPPPGPHGAGLHITSNDADESTYSVWISAEPVQAKLVATIDGVTRASGSMNDVSRTAVGETSILTIRLRNEGMFPVASTEPINTHGDNAFASTGPATFTLNPMEEVIYTVNFSPMARGVYQGSIWFPTNDPCTAPGYTLMFRGICNNIPNAGQVAVTTAEDTPAPGISFSFAGSDADGEILSYLILKSPDHGTLQHSGGATASYVPDPNFHGTDTIIYRVYDGLEFSNTASVTITVTAVNDLPVAQAQSLETPENSALAIVLSATDIDSTELTYEIVTPPLHGRLSGTAPNLLYTPDNNFHGSDHFDFRVSDGDTTPNPSGTARVTISVISDGIDPPELDVESAQGDPIPHQGTLDLGASPVSVSIQFTLKLKNTGLAPLTGSMPQISGFHDTDFVVTTAPAFPVAPGAETTMTVRFTPSGTGLRVTDLFIPTNDNNESPYTIRMQGVGTGPGLLDSTFQSPFTSAGGIAAIAVQPDGKILYGGSFVVGPNPQRVNLARVNADGSLDPSFQAVVSDSVTSIAVLPGGKIVIGGIFNDVNGLTRLSLARLNPDGSVDPVFAPSFNSYVNCLAVQSDGKLIVGGNFTQVNGTARGRIARLNEDGSLDPFFNPTADGEVNCLYLTEVAERVLVGGNFGSISGGAREYLASLWSNGELDESFTPNLSGGPVSSILQHSGGGWLIGGFFATVDGQGRGYVARLDGVGRLDTTFSPVNYANRPPVWGLHGQMDGKILLTGYFYEVATQWRNGIARLNANGTLDTGFNPDPWEAASSAAIQSDGKVLMSGNFTTVGGLPQIGVARVLNDPATNSLTVTGPNRIEWTMGGSFPAPYLVTFEVSEDGQVTWEPLGAGRQIGMNQTGWEKINTTLPAGGHVRALARVSSGKNGGSSGLIEAVTTFGVPPQPEITVQTNTHSNVESGDTIDLGLAPSPGELTRLVKIRNTGPAPLEISEISLLGTDTGSFSLIDAPTGPFTLPRNQLAEFTLRFAPTTAGSKTATLRILSNDGDEGTFDLNFSGQALAPTITHGPVSETVDVGTNWALSVTATGSPPLAYQWYVGSPGDTSQPLGSGAAIVPTGPITATTSYWVRVSNAFGQTEHAFTFSVNYPPTVSAFADRSIAEDTVTGLIPFTIGDSESPPESLWVSAQSNNQALVPDGFISVGGTGENRQMIVTPISDQHGEAIISVTVSDGRLLTTQSFLLTVTPVNDGPVIGSITARSMDMNASSGLIEFTVNDIDNPPGSLVVSATSGNPALVAEDGFQFGGSGGNRNLIITPVAHQFGTTTITVTVSDGELNASRSFDLTVIPPNYPPTLSDIFDRTTNEDTATPAIAFTIGDVETSAGSLTVSATSSNTALVGSGNMVFGGSGANRNLVITPLPNQHGTAVITVTVSDGQLTAAKTFTLTVTPVNDVPTIANITDKSTPERTPTAAISFTVGDIDTDVASLTVTATSGNTTLVPNANIAISGSGASRQLIITPAPHQNGSAVITVTVSDGSLTASDTFTLTVTPVNDAPTIADIADQSTNEDTATAPIAFTIADIDTALTSLTLSAISSNTALVGSGNMVFSGSGANRNLVITPLPNQHGTTVITVTVSDGGLTASVTFTLTVNPVNDAPTIANITDKSTPEGTPTLAIPFTVGDIDTDLANLTVTASSGNTTLVPNANIVLSGTGANRQLVITPAPLQNGTALITVTVSDGALTATDTFTLTVTPVNDPPTIADIADQTTAEDTPTAPIAITVGDIDNPAGSLTVSASSGNTSLVASGAFAFSGSGTNRTLVVTPLANQHGTAVITVTVSDGQLTASKNFTLTVTPVNDAPTIGLIANQSTTRGTATPTIAFVVGDLDNAPATLTLDGASSNAALLPVSGIVFTGSGTNRGVTVTPASDQIGTVSVTVTVSDGALSASRSFTLDVRVPKPVITSPATATGRRNDPFQYLITATDAPASFTVAGLPTGLTLNTSTGQISGTPTVHGSFPVTLSATNSSGTGQRVITLTIDPPIPPPVVLNPKILAGNVNVPISFQASASNTPQAYELLNAPAWLSISTSGLITGTPTVIGTFHFKIRASNQSGPGAYTDVALTVEPHPQAPSITSIVQVRGRQSVAFSHALTADPAATSFALVSGTLPPGVTFTPVNGTFSGTPTAAGTYNITLSASNAFGAGRAAPLRIIIDQPPQVPVISSTASLSGSVGAAFSTTVSATFFPNSFTFSNLPAWLTQNGATGQLSGTPPSAGTFNIDVFATNGDGAGPVQRLVLNVAHSPNAPTIQLAGDFTAFQGLPFNATILTSPAATALTATGLPPGITVNSAARTLGGTPLQPGEHKVTMQASNASGAGPAVTARFVVRPTPGAPEITSSLAEFPLGLQPFTYQIQARSEIPVLGYAATGLPAGLSVNAGTGQISGSPQVLGTFEVKLFARNAVGAGAESTLVLTVRPGPNVPKITSAASTSGVAGQTLTYQITADNNPTSYAAEGLPEGVVLNSVKGVITGKPLNPGTYDVKVSAANLNGSGPAQVVRFGAASSLGAPILTVPAYVWIYGQSVSWRLEAQGMPPKPWTSGTGFHAENLPSGLALNTSTGVVSGVPISNVSATYFATFYAAANGIKSKPVICRIKFSPTRDVPVSTGPKSLNAQSGSSLNFRMTADRSCSRWQIEIYSRSSFGQRQISDSIDQASPHFSIPAYRLPRPGKWIYDIGGYNTSGWGLLSGLTLTVDPASGAPAITSTEVLVGRAGTALTVALTASASSTSFAADFAGNAPSGVTFDSTTGQFSGTPSTPGNYSFLARARNTAGWSLPKFTTLAILPATTQQPQAMQFMAFSAASQTEAPAYRVGEAMTYTPTVPFAANYFVMSDLPPGLVYNQTTGEISGTPERPGDFTVKLRPFSDTIIGAEIEVPFTVLPVEGAPEVATDIVIEGTAGEELTHTMTATETPLGFNFSELPDFVIVDALTGEVTGTPPTPGTYEMVVGAFNALGEGMPAVVRFEIAPAEGTPVTTLAAPLPALQVGVPFTAQLQASASTDFFDSGSLPYGIDLDRETGVLSGTPLEAGTFEISVWGVNSVGQGGALELAMTIALEAATPIISNPDVIHVLSGEDVSIQLHAEPTADSLTLAPLPDGLVFDPASGLLTGQLPVGSWTVQVSGTNGLGTGPEKSIRIESHGSPASLWKGQKLAGLDPALTGWNASALGDGISNLMKYAVGMEPRVASPFGLPAISIQEVGGERYLTMIIEKNPEATDVIFRPEISSELDEAAWRSGPAHLEVLENTPERLVVRDLLPVSANDRRFARLRVELTE
jgi:uncharacterized delta-60 repeat protein